MRYENYVYKTTVKVDDSKTMWVVPNCPFCGEEAKMNHNRVGEWEVKCTSCGASGGLWPTKKAALKTWGRTCGMIVE